MPEVAAVLEIDKSLFTVRLYEDFLRIDVKGSFKNELEEALENKPVLKETIGALLGIFAPLHIRVGHIDSARVINSGKVKLVLPLHRDVVIPLDPEEAKRLVDKLNSLIPAARRKELLRAVMMVAATVVVTIAIVIAVIVLVPVV